MKLSLKTIATFGIIMFSGNTQSAQNYITGKTLFENKCSRCHGTNGTKELFGAKNLQKSTLTEEEYFSIISNGKRIMPAWKNKLSNEEIKQIIGYIKSFRK